MRGRKPEPINNLQLRGSWRAKGKEGLAFEGIAEPPDDLPDAVRTIWERLVGILGPKGLATPADRDALVSYCRWVQLGDFAFAWGEREGWQAKTGAGEEKVHPAFHMLATASAQSCKLGALFGLNPVDRARFRVESAPPSLAVWSRKRS